MNLDIKEVTLLSEGEVFGLERIDITNRMGGRCAISDFAILLGAYVSDEVYIDDDSSLKGRTTWWWTRSSDGDGDVRTVLIDGDRHCTYAGKRCGAVRPALPFSNISAISPNGVRGRSGFLEVEYGEYPQYAVDTRLARTLDSELSADRLKKTGKTYTTDSRLWNAYSESFKAREHYEYEFNGKKYVKVKYVDTDSCKLSNGGSYNNGDEVWVEVSPITWLVDERSGLMLSKTCLASGIRFCKNRKYRDEFKKTEMYMFLNEYFAKDIIPSKIEQEELEATHIEELIQEIYKYAEPNPNNEKIHKRVKEAINEYNEKADELNNSFEINEITVENLESLTYDLELKLNMILSDVKSEYEKYKQHFDMITVINDYIDIIKGKEEDNGRELSKDLLTITKISLPFLKEENSNNFKEDLIRFLENTKKEIANFLKGNKKSIEYNTVDEMDLHIRKEMHEILKKLLDSVNQRDLENEIKTAIAGILSDEYAKPKNEFLALFLEEIDNIYYNINNLLHRLPETKKDEISKELNIIMQKEINYDRPFNEVTKDLIEMWRGLNKIQYSIQKYLGEKTKFQTRNIDLSKFKR